MYKDIFEEKNNFIAEQQDLSENSIKKMKRTSKYIKCGNMTLRYLGLFLEILVSYSEMVCYLFMIVSMMKNAGFISLIYPIAVFGYALM